ncbi:hypothetical protein RFI_01604 [Reticulomyxa filosa]|uniref:Calcium-transporting ATPase n=1 Tax=Reticulomyxa filosa TaxID=46433 RepID=X6PBM9_RETFI|nr:hypothetical protein RFI_01604 [Reticulomyxa filosa]|eukprot:ETO35459.1 hypothetical protein RFI_01604 [Reticulomyxa filosa]
MGNATTICSDKTGTLTQNSMSVTKAFVARTKFFAEPPSRESLGDKLFDTITQSVVCNSKVKQNTLYEYMFMAFHDTSEKPKLVGGNQTECAMLQWALELGAKDYKQIRTDFPVTKFFPFDSAVKSSSVLVKGKELDQYFVYTKGAAEQIMDWCIYYMDRDGQHQDFTEEMKDEIRAVMNGLMDNGLRCLGVLYKELKKSEIQFQLDGTVKEEGTEHFFRGMTWLCLCAIQDPIRPEVPEAVKLCQNAGITVRMVTGDNIGTAKYIARQCGILTRKGNNIIYIYHICMTGSEFRQLSDKDKHEVLPKLRVLARSKPTDKEALVEWYKTYNNDVVAVTGDGANDALALTKADVGLSMGIQGTDVAKEASDIVIMDDNFASIVKTVMWGRSVFDNIRKFVQFQSTVNAVALMLSVIAAFWKQFANPLTAVQLLWVNLIMDTMAALALATEPPSMSLLQRNPYTKDALLISKLMQRFIIGSTVYQLVVLFITLFRAEQWGIVGDGEHNSDGQNKELLTLVFNLFVGLQVANEINARRVQNEWNVFSGIIQNPYFVGIIIITVCLQVLIIYFGGAFTSTVGLGWEAWVYTLGVSIGILLWR